MSKYMRKTPVEAIQWNGHNLNELIDVAVPIIEHGARQF